MPEKAEPLWEEILIIAGIEVEKKPEADEIVEGVYLGAVDRESRFGPVKLHIFHDPSDGVATGLWGSHALDEGLGRCAKGRQTRVTGMGKMELAEGRDMWLFRVHQAGAVLQNMPSLGNAEKVAEADGVFEALGMAENAEELDELVVDLETGKLVARA
ncbi:MAG: hypothetical protein IIA54_00535 [Chloroflexi bacterium]|nr:hypothetical protein [Chloroflexota bacterium]